MRADNFRCVDPDVLCPPITGIRAHLFSAPGLMWRHTVRSFQFAGFFPHLVDIAPISFTLFGIPFSVNLSTICSSSASDSSFSHYLHSSVSIESIFVGILLLLIDLLSICFTHHRIPFLLMFSTISSFSVSDSSFSRYFRFSVFPLNPSSSVSFILRWALAFCGGFMRLFLSLPLMTSSLLTRPV